MVVTCRQMSDAEEAAFSRGVTAEKLMELAGAGIAAVIRQFYPEGGHLVLYLGKGNNGGDALAAARHLIDAGWEVHARLTSDVSSFKELPMQHWSAMQGRVRVAGSAADIASLRGQIVLVDGLVGIGASGALRGRLAEAAEEINLLKYQRHAAVVALDLPSGLNSISGEPGTPCVEADLTITIAHPKSVLLQDVATRCVGRLAVVPLPDLDEAQGDGSQTLLTPASLLATLARRPFDFHKGQAGRVGIVAGSRGYLGAAVLASSGALRAGAGLVTLYVREEDYPLMVGHTPPEVMVKPVSDYRSVLEDGFDSLAIGSGLGSGHRDEVLAVIQQATCPTVLDADALNLLSRTGLQPLLDAAGPRLLTPHPGEMKRLADHHPEWLHMTRSQVAVDFVGRYPLCTLLLKGSRTVIAAAGQPLAYNSTGHPGMATGGMGDVLSGVSAALAALGLPLYQAACLGAWLCGRASERAILQQESPQSLAAGDVPKHLGGAYRDLESLAY